MGILIFDRADSQPPTVTADERNAQELIHYYLDLLRSGNYESARILWEPTCLEQSTRLNIRYDNIPIKADCNSPFVYDYDKLKAFLPDAIVSKAKLDSVTFRWKLEVTLDDDEIAHYYYTTLIDGYHWVIPPHYYYSKGWPVRESKYFRFMINPERLMHYNEIGIRALDDAVESIAAELHIAEEKLALLAEKKIDYYLCLDGSEVEKLSGVRDRGVYNVAFDAVITCFFPHYNKVALLLINLKLQELPLFTIPMMRDGLATSLGGRWQRAPEVVYDFGDYIMKYDIIDPDSVLTYRQYYDIAAGDVTSPVGACLSKYIYLQFGEDIYFELYRLLSGDYEFVTGLTPEQIKQSMTSTVDLEWSDFLAGFHGFMEKRRQCHGLIHPGNVETDKILIDRDGLILSASDKWLKIEYKNYPEEHLEVNLLLDRDSVLTEKASMLFDEQYKDRYSFEGYRYGIKLDKNEIGLYDYATNQIKAKFIDDPGGELLYYDSVQHKVSAYFDISLIENSDMDVTDYRILK